MRTSPVRFSGHAAWSGKTAAIKSSAFILWIGGGTFRPPEYRGIARAREAFHRQRAPNIGAGSSAWVSTSSTVAGLRKSNTMSNGKERSEEHTSELQSRVDISYAVFCLKKKK